MTYEVSQGNVIQKLSGHGRVVIRTSLVLEDETYF